MVRNSINLVGVGGEQAEKGRGICCQVFEIEIGEYLWKNRGKSMKY